MRQIFFGLVLLLVGVALGFLLRQTTDAYAAAAEAPSDVGPAADVPSREAAQPKRSELASVPEADVQRSAPTRLPAAPASYELQSGLQQLIDRLPVAMGDATLTGRVVDELGAPIEGATLIVTGPINKRSRASGRRDPNSIGRAYDGRPQIASAYMMSLVSSSLYGLREAGNAVADPTGGFQVSGLAEGTFFIEAYAEGFAFEPATSDLSAPLELTGKTVTTFDLALVGPGDRVPEEATIVVQGRGPNSQHFRWTPDEPTMRVTSRIVTLQAFAGDLVDAGSGQFRADSSSPLTTIDRDADGEGPHRLQLEAYPSVLVDVRAGPDAGQPFEPWCDLVRGTQRISVTRRDSAAFIAFDVTAGPYTVEVGRGDGPAEFTEEVVVDTGRVALDVELGPLDPARYLVAHCVDVSGRPVQDISWFLVQVTAGRTSHSTSIYSQARANGEYWLSLERGMRGSSRIVRGSIDSLTLTASSPSLGDVTLDVDPNLERAEFLFQRPTELLVLVTGVLSPGLEVSVEVWSEKSERWQRSGQSTTVPGDGSLVLKPLTPGPARILLRSADSPFRVPLAAMRVELKEGMNQLRIEAPESHDLVVLIPGLTDKRFELLAQNENGEFESRANGKVEQDDRLIFANIPPGRYRVQYRDTFGPVVAQYTVPCGEVVFEPAPIDGFEVLSVSKGSIAEKVGLQAGDVLVRVDHLTPSAENFVLEFTSRVTRPEGATLRVRRGSTTQELIAAPGKPEGGSFLGLGARFQALIL